MITYADALTVEHFHIRHASLPCTVWDRADVTRVYGSDGLGFMIPIAIMTENGRQFDSITGVNAVSFHTPAMCPHARAGKDGEPPVAGNSGQPEQLVLAGGLGADGYDVFGFDADGYDRKGYDKDGYDRKGYDEDGYDVFGYNVFGYNAFGFDADGYNREGYNREGFDSGGYNRDGYDADDKDRYGNARPGSLDAVDLDLAELWADFRYSRFSSRRQADFREHLRELVSDPGEIDDLGFCGNCGEPGWGEDLNSARGGELSICESCYDDWSDCARCDSRYPDDDLTEVLSGSSICDSCREYTYLYCDDCAGWYHDDDAGEHEHEHDDDDDDSGCCESPQPEFEIRNDGCEPLANDTRATITLPAGTISSEGLKAIRDYLLNQAYSVDRLQYVAYDLDTLGNQWQTRTGNYAKRLSRHAHTTHHVRLTPENMSQVGCIARDHSTAVAVAIEVTRELNMSAGDFYNDGSCWWNSYRESRCALKTNGGFGLRSFTGDSVSGRAWVLPLRLDERGRLAPTFDTVTPAAFVVFNGYGDLSGYAAPRIVAHMAGWTYRKIDFFCSPMYVNAGGYLIAPEEIAAPYTDGSLRLSVNQHSSLFESERELANA